MKLRTKELESAYGASFGRVRKWNPAVHQYLKFHQGWDLEAPTGTPCYAIAPGIITSVGHHPQFGKYVLLQFSKTAPDNTSSADSLWAFYAHLSSAVVTEGTLVDAGQMIGYTGHSGNASASAPHLHFEVRSVPTPSPGLGGTGRLDPATVLGYHHLVCS